jgi:hypothetical protein
MSLPRVLFWSGLGLLVLLWLGSLGAAFGNGGLQVPGAVRGSGHLITQSRELAEFRRISNDGSVDLDISVGPEQSVAVVADDNIAPRVETQVRDGELFVSERGSYWGLHSLKVKIVVPQLDALNLEGSGDAEVKGVTGSSIDLSTHGSGDITASGRVDKVSLSGYGSGDAYLEKLDADDAVVKLRGSGDAHVNASRTLDVEIFGSGDVHYRGSPRVNSTVKGSGDVTQD